MGRTMTTEEREELVAGGLVTVKEAARLTGLSVSFLYQRMEAGELAYAKFGRARRIPRNSLDRLMAAALVGGGNAG